MRKFIVPGILLVMLAFWISPAAAIVFGDLDGGDHPNVGLLLITLPDREPIPVCSGILVEDPRAFLTAGHCTSLLQDAIDQQIITKEN